VTIPKQALRPRDVGRHYDELDRFYREIWGEHVHHGLWVTGQETPEEAVHQLLRRVARHAALDGGETICDVGSGYGATARWLAETLGARVTALTLSRRQQAYAEQQPDPSPAPRYRRGDWLDNDLPAEAFDAVLMIESLAHMARPQTALREAFRVLKPGGCLVICAWLTCEEPPAWATRWLIDPIIEEGRLSGLPSAAEMQRRLDRVGFKRRAVENLSRDVRRTWSVVVKRVLGGLLHRADYRRYLLDRAQQNRRFAIMPPYLWIAYRIGVMGYGLFAVRKPKGEPLDGPV